MVKYNSSFIVCPQYISSYSSQSTTWRKKCKNRCMCVINSIYKHVSLSIFHIHTPYGWLKFRPKPPQEHKLQLHSLSRESYLSQLSQLEERCSGAFKQAAGIAEQIERLEGNGEHMCVHVLHACDTPVTCSSPS